MIAIWTTLLSYWNSLWQYGFEFEHPERAWYIVPIMLVFIFFLRKRFVFLQESTKLKDQKTIDRMRNYRILMFLSRSIIFLLLVVALAGPILRVNEKIYGERSITMITDLSDSMQMYDTSFIPGLQSEMEKEIPVKPATTGSAVRSNIGDAILANLGQNRNLLLITDGNANAGSDMGDAALFAAELNASISVIQIEPLHSDYSVIVEGPSKVLSMSESEYTVTVRQLQGKEAQDQNFEIKVMVDGNRIFNLDVSTQGDTKIATFRQTFQDGQHTIEASISVDDYFEQNNVFYKTVKSVPKPKLLLLTQKTSPLEQIFMKLYDTDKRDKMPDKLDDYYVVVINDMPASAFSNSDVDKLGNFVNDGNGLIAFGGDRSFEYGKYKDSQLLSLLPVTIGVGEKQPRPDLNAIVIIDVSEGQAGFDTLGLAKAHSLNIIDQFRLNDNVGVVAFSEQYYTVSAINKMTPDHVAEVRDKIERLNFIPATSCSSIRVCSNIVAGITGASKLLEGVAGRKWVFLYSDGQYFDYLTGDYINWAVDELNEQNIVMYSTMSTKTQIGDIRYTWEGAEGALRRLAERTGGIYFPPSDSDRMRLLFGKQTDAKTSEEGGLRSIMVLNRFHFITEDLEPTAKISGYNQIVPKAGGRLLMTTSLGEPLLAVWRFGLGRVATFATDDGTAWAGQVLNKDNSKLISRMVNWGIGDPERKLELYTQVGDGIVNESIEVIVKSSKYPKSEELNFYKVDENLYSAKFIASELGFGKIVSNIYAANYKPEYEKLGFNPELSNIVQATDGKIFKPSEAKEIVDYVSKRSERVDIQKKKVSWPFIVAALILFLLEVLIRRIQENSRKDD